MERLQKISSSLKSPSKEPLQNWAKSMTFSTSNIYYPKTVADVQEIVRSCEKVRVVGSRHSFSKIADSTEALICTDFLNKLVALDTVNNTVTVEGGMKYGDLATFLHERGYGLSNLASLPHITIAGSLATATHGSGVNNKGLTSSVVAFELVKADGEVIVISRKKDGELFDATVVTLGGFGVVTKVTLELEPTYDVQQDVYLNLPMKSLEKHFMEVASGAYSVSLFTNWQNKNMTEVWFKARSPKISTLSYPAELFGAKLATKKMHPVETQDAEPCTEQLGVPGPWCERLAHFKMNFNPSTGKELQTEYFIPIEKAYEAIMAIESLNEKIAPYVLVTEVRMIQADSDWMSPNYKRNAIGIHFTWKQEWEAVQKLLPQIETVLEPLKPIPHWSKLHTFSPSKLQSRYEKIGEFRELLKKFDPTGKFRNEFMNTYIFGK